MEFIQIHEFHLITILIGLLLLLILLLVIFQCMLPCCGRSKKSRDYSDDQVYYHSINRLVERQKRIDQQREEHERVKQLMSESMYSIPSPLSLDQSQSPQLRRPNSRTSSRSPTTRRPGSRSSSLNKPETVERLAKLKEELEQYKVDHSIKIRLEEPNLDERRRTWGGLQDDYLVNDQPFEPVQLPNIANIGVQTTGTLERKPFLKVETTV